MNKSPDYSRLKVLVVDDNSFMCTVLTQVLTALGVGSVETAATAAEAFRMVAEDRPDLVISDWDMDPVDGLTLVEWLRRREDSPDCYIPIVMLTGFSERKRVLRARDSGINEFLAKPVSARSVWSRLNEVVTRPRPFVRADSYVGPDRRRRADPHFGGDNRRSPEGVVYL